MLNNKQLNKTGAEKFCQNEKLVTTKILIPLF